MKARPVRSLVAGLVLGLPIAAALARLTGPPGTPLVVLVYYGVYLPVLMLLAAPWLVVAAVVLVWLSNHTFRSVRSRACVSRTG